MRTETFVRAIELFEKRLIKSMRRRNVTPESAQEAVQNMVARKIEDQSYLKVKGDVVDTKTFSYLRQAATWELAKIARRNSFENEVFLSIGQLEDDGDEAFSDTRERSAPARECPFCHVSELNQFSACGFCHTILGQGKAQQARLSIDEADLQSCPDIDMSIDVQQALETLEPLERKLIERVAIGADSLEDMAEVTGSARKSLWRVYVVAKEKLRRALADYQPRGI